MRKNCALCLLGLFNDNAGGVAAAFSKGGAAQLVDILRTPACAAETLFKALSTIIKGYRSAGDHFAATDFARVLCDLLKGSSAHSIEDGVFVMLVRLAVGA